MPSRFTKTIVNSQPAILMVSGLVYVGLDRRWPVALGVCFLLQLGLLLAGAWRERHPERHRENVRFLARAVVTPVVPPCAPTATEGRRPHLRLV